MRKIIDLYADFETTALATSPEVYSACLLKDENNFDIFIDIKDFISKIEKLNSDCNIWFNNMKGFDGHFLIPALDEMGYTVIMPLDEVEEKIKNGDKDQKKLYKKYYDERIKAKTILYMKNKKKTLENALKMARRYWNRLLPNEYNLICNENHNIYSIKIAIPTTKRTNGNYKNRLIQFSDSMLLFPKSIAGMGKMLNKIYKTKEWSKGTLESEYNRKTRYDNILDFFLDNKGNEVKYLKQDCLILKKFHEEMKKVFPRKDWQMTIGSTSYKEWTKHFGKELFEMFKDNYIPVKLKNGMIKYKTKTSKKLKKTTDIYKELLNDLLPTNWMNFSKLAGEKKIYKFDTSIHQNIYKWYNGGITMVNEKYRGVITENVSVADINSSYPTQMVKDIQAPVGEGVPFNKKENKFKLYEMIVLNKMENKKGLPFLYDSNSVNREYVSTLKSGMVIYLNSIEYKYFKKYYSHNKGDYSLTVKWSFQTISMRKIFGTFIEKWYKNKVNAKKTGNLPLAEIAKLFLNALYGKFGTKEERISRIWNPYKMEWEKHSSTLKSKYYLPLAITITSLARLQLVEAVDTHYDNFLYCDTDSIFIKDLEKLKLNIKYDKYNLGDWDIEFEKGIGIVRRSKQYYFQKTYIDNDNKLRIKKKVAFAGNNFYKTDINDNEEEIIKKQNKTILDNLTIKDFIFGKTIRNQTIAKRILSYGVIILKTEKEIKPIWEYKKLSQQKYWKKEHFLKLNYKYIN